MLVGYELSPVSPWHIVSACCVTDVLHMLWALLPIAQPAGGTAAARVQLHCGNTAANQQQQAEPMVEPRVQQQSLAATLNVLQWLAIPAAAQDSSV